MYNNLQGDVKYNVKTLRLEMEGTMNKLKTIGGLLLCTFFILSLVGQSKKEGNTEFRTIAQQEIKVAEGVEEKDLNSDTLEQMDTFGIGTDESGIYVLYARVTGYKGLQPQYTYYEAVYDMKTTEVTKRKLPQLSQQVNPIGKLHGFQRDEAGNWYCLLEKWDEQAMDFCTIKDGKLVTQLVKIEKDEMVPIPEIQKQFEKYECFHVGEQGKLLFMKNVGSQYVAGENFSLITYDVVNQSETSTGELLVGAGDWLSVGNTHLVKTVMPMHCGFRLKQQGNQTVRTLYCEGKAPEAGWESQTVFSVLGEDDRVYMLNAGGIYAGSIKDKMLERKVDSSLYQELNLFLNDFEKEEKSYEPDRYVEGFCLGSDTEKEDFYLYVVEEDVNEEENKYSVELRHLL